MTENAQTLAQQAQAAPQDPKYNWIYRKLVQGPDDAVGAFAYVLYKEDKISWLDALGKEPTTPEWVSFHTATCTPSQMQGYRDRAQKLVDDFLRTVLEDRIMEIEADARVGALGTKFDLVLNQLSEKKTFYGWLRDVGSNLAVNFLTIILIGSVILGYNTWSRLSSQTEGLVGVNQLDAPKGNTGSQPTKAHQDAVNGKRPNE